MNNSNSLDVSREQAFIRQVKSLNPEQVGANFYEQSYFSHLQLHLDYYVSIYSFLFREGVARSGKIPGELILIDYGTGNGLLGIYLKYMGAGRVYVNDLNASCLVSCRAFAKAMNVQLDGYLLGDVESLKEINDSVDLLLSTDVIEHIYNPEVFLRNLRAIQPSAMAVFSTASNPFNRFKVWQLRKLQYRDEFINSADVRAGVEKQYRTPFFERRVQILEEEFPQFSPKEIMLLASKSRGMRKDDLVRLATDFIHYGKLPELPVDLYNTCDPDTGIWTERVLPVTYFQNLAERNEYTLELKFGLYNDFGRHIAAGVKKLINFFIAHFPSPGKFIAPYFVLFLVPDRTPK